MERTDTKRREPIRADEFCSRKLFDLVRDEEKASPEDLRAAIAELSQRRHYLSELEQLGKLTPKSR